MRDFDSIKQKEMGSIENRIRHIYNRGYEDGLKDGKESCQIDETEYQMAKAMAIEALEQEPCIQEKQANADKIDAVYIDGFKAGYSQAKFDLEQEPCEDAISRKELMNRLDESGIYGLEEIIKSIPSVIPTQKIGRWMFVHPLQDDDGGAYMCSRCEMGDWSYKNDYRYCPNCGAKMEVDE